MAISYLHLDDESLQALEKLTCLKKLFSSGNDFTEDALTNFFKTPVFKSLESIGMFDMTMTPDAIINCLSNVESDLKFLFGRFELDNVIKIVKCKYLKNLNFFIQMNESSFGNSHLEALLNPEEGVK